MLSVRKRYTMMVAALMAAALTAVSCSTDEVVDKQRNGVINFLPVVNNVTTTRSVTLATTENFSEFDVWAFKADDDKADDASYVIGKNNTRGIRIRKGSDYGKSEQTNSNSNIWGYANEREIAFWPSDGTQSLQFYAVSPSTTTTSVTNLSLNITKADHAFTYTCEDDNHARQTDLLITGKKVGLTDLTNLSSLAAPNEYMMVSMTFKHALSQAVFEAKLQSGYSGLEVHISNIEICNIYRTGVCEIGNTDGTPTWTNLQDKASYTIAINGTEGVTLSTTDGTSGNASNVQPLSNGNEGFNDNILLIPQTLTAWTTTSGAAAATTQQGSYLKIKCTIMQNGFNLLKEGEEYVYVPFGNTNPANFLDNEPSQPWNGTFEAGKKYRFTLEFGLGYDSNGQKNGNTIKCSVSASDWEDKSTTILNN